MATRRKINEYDWAKLEFDARPLPNLSKRSSTRRDKIRFIVVHHMTIVGKGTGSANDACINTWKSREASAHYGVDGEVVAQFVWDHLAAWATATVYGNHAGISIEHANSSAGPKWEVSDTTWKTGAKLAAHLCLAYKLGRPKSGTNLRQHSNFFKTACAGPYLGKKVWKAYVAEAQRVYDELVSTPSTPAPVTPPKEPTPVPSKPVTVKPSSQTVTVLSLNAASKNKAVIKSKGSWAKRAPKVADFIVDKDAHFVCLQEVYGPEVKVLDKLLEGKYQRKAYKGGRVIYRRSGLSVMTASSASWVDLIPGGGTKYAVARKFTYPSGSVLNLVNAHLSYETSAVGVRKRAKEVPALIAWVRKRFSKGYDLYVGDFNSPYGGTTRRDDVGPLFAKAGLRDLGKDAKATAGKGKYHLDRAFGGAIKGKKVQIFTNGFTDHPGVLFTVSIPTK